MEDNFVLSLAKQILNLDQLEKLDPDPDQNVLDPEATYVCAVCVGVLDGGGGQGAGGGPHPQHQHSPRQVCRIYHNFI